MSDIYNDQSYVANNPQLHREDSAFKFEQIAGLLEQIQIHENRIKILDVGGGAGVLGGMAAEYFTGKGVGVEFVALDLSAEMLGVQAQSNPHIVRIWNCSVVDCPEKEFDLVLMIDVIEHIQNKDMAANRLNEIGKNVIYNIPIQINVVDLLRNAVNRGLYYSEQTRLIGHVHFFSYASARRFVDRHHHRIVSSFKPYCVLMLGSRDLQYVELRKGRVRLAEVKISCWIAKYLPWLAPWVVQGSMFTLVSRKPEIAPKR